MRILSVGPRLHQIKIQLADALIIIYMAIKDFVDDRDKQRSALIEEKNLCDSLIPSNERLHDLFLRHILLTYFYNNLWMLHFVVSINHIVISR